MALLPLRPLPFSQPSPDATAAGGHPHKNLGKFLHAPKAKSKHRTHKAPFPTGKPYQPQVNPDYKPAGDSRAKNLTMKSTQVAGPNMGQSDVNSEAIGSLMGPASTSSTPPAFKSRKAKAKQMPFYG